MTPPRPGFGARLGAVIDARGPLCVGIDPHPSLLRDWGLSLDSRGVAEFSRLALEAFGDLAAVVKPQVALYEEYGSAGIAVLEEVLDLIAGSGAVSIADAKRGDIGSTMAAYARAWLADGSPLAADAVTVSPYLGVGALEPAFELAVENGRGVFVLARTSNPEATEVQQTVAQSVVDDVGEWNRRAGTQREEERSDPFGLVVGATVEIPPDLSGFGGPVLMPGVGAQGASMADAWRVAGTERPGPGGIGNGLGGAAGVPTGGRSGRRPGRRSGALTVLPNVSRQVLAAGPDPEEMRGVVRSLLS